MSLRIAISLLAFACSTVVTAAGSERLVQAPLPGFKIGFEATQNGETIQEQVPVRENVDRWTRMVTTQRFEGAAARMRPWQLLDNMIGGLRGTCAGARVSTIARRTVSGRPAAEMRVDCPRSPATGLPESFLALAIAGASDMHMVQVAFRRVPSAADITWAQRQLGSVKLQ